MTSATEVITLSDDSEEENSPPDVSLTPIRSPPDPAKAASLSADLVAHLATMCPKLRRAKVGNFPHNNSSQPFERDSGARLQLFKTEPDVEVSNRTKKPGEKLDTAIKRLPIKTTVSLPVKPKEITLVEKLFVLCRRHVKDKTDTTILDKMRSKLQKLENEYQKMPAFADFVNDIHHKVALNPENMHVHLGQFYSRIHKFCKSHKSKVDIARPTTSNCGAGTSRDVSASTSRDLSASTSRDLSASTSRIAVPKLPKQDHSPAAAVSSASAASGLAVVTDEQKQKKRVEKLEGLLKSLDDRIKQLEAKELDLDDLDEEESTYVLVDRYKQRFVKVLKKLYHLNKETPNTGRHIEKKFKFEGTRYPEINREIQGLVKSKFPDYCDVLRIVRKVNEEKGLHIKPSAVKYLANRIFDDVGKVLKKRRDRDYRDDFGCLLGEEEEQALLRDPADEDPLLSQKLEESRKLAELKRTQVFEYFVKKQIELESGDGPDDGNDDCNMEVDFNAAFDLSPPTVEIDRDPDEATVSTALLDGKRNAESQSWNSQRNSESQSWNPQRSAESQSWNSQGSHNSELLDLNDSQSFGACDAELQLRISSPRTIALSQHEGDSSKAVPVSVCRPMYRESPPDLIEAVPPSRVVAGKPERYQDEVHAANYTAALTRPTGRQQRQPANNRAASIPYNNCRDLFKVATINASAQKYEVEIEVEDDDDVIVLE